MSSKSRKHSSPAPKARRPVGDVVPGAREARQERPGLDPEDELIHAPREVSKLRFVLMIALVIFLLIIFIVPSAFEGLGRSVSREDAVALEWSTPGGGRGEIRSSELYAFHTALDDARSIDVFLPYSMGFLDPRRIDIKDTARILILSHLAEEAGIRVTQADLGEYLKGSVVDFRYQGNVEAYKRDIASRRTPVESTIRRCLTVQRFFQLVGYAGSIAHPEAVEKAWKEQHVEIAFDYLKVDVSEFTDAALTELPDDTELEAWFDAKPDAEKTAYYTPERRTIDAIVYRDAEKTPAAGLLAAFPEPEDTVAEERAREYYRQVYFRRFLKHEDEPEEDLFAIPEYLSFEDVQEACLAEAPIFFAMQEWLRDVRSRTEAGEEVDVVAEAVEHGLEVVRLEGVTRKSLEEDESFGDYHLINALFATGPDDLSTAPAWVEGIAGFGKTVERIEPSLPPFEELRGKVADEWAAPRAEELAMEHLRHLWEGLETFEPEDEVPGDRTVHRRSSEEAFRALAQEAGLEVHRRDYLDRGGKADADPEQQDVDHAFLWGRNYDMGRMEPDEVAAPAAGNGGDTVYLVRLAGTREVPLSKMSPGDYENFRRMARNSVRTSLPETMSLDFLRKQYGLVERVEGVLREEESSEESEG